MNSSAGVAVNHFAAVAAAVSALLAAALINPAAAQPPAAAERAAQPPFAWVQAHPDAPGAEGRLIARAIVAAGQPCPALQIGDGAQAMQARPNPVHEDFAITVCEAVYDGTVRARIGNTQLPVRPAEPSRILVLGDSGCRITDYAVQACGDPAQWPWHRIAAAAARQNPDLIIHVGDYHYREKPCAGRAHCDGSPWGDTWPAWQADFFAAAAPLLPVAPWVMVRGNHEECARAGTGWQLLLAPHVGATLQPPCANDTEPYRLAFGRLQLAVLDTATAGNSYARVQRTAEYEVMLEKLAPTLAPPGGAPARETWLLLHHPLWSKHGGCDTAPPFQCTQRDVYQAVRQALRADAGTPVNSDQELNRLLRDVAAGLQDPLAAVRTWVAGRATSPSPIALVVSGHVHAFQMFAPAPPAFPPQLVAGTGGDVLDVWHGMKVQAEAQPATLYGVEGGLWSRQEFGFVMLVRGDAGWTATFHAVDGAAKLVCDLAARSCRSPPP